MRLISAGSLVRAQSGPPSLDAFRPFPRREHPANRQPGKRATDIDHGIDRGRCSRWHKRLMKFITRGKDCASERGDEKQDRHLQLPANAMVQCPPEQHRQDRVFRQMTELSDRELNLSESRKRNLGIEPAQKRDQEPRGMLGREDIGRTEEDYRHPNN
jgi:hypothetical protein